MTCFCFGQDVLVQELKFDNNVNYKSKHQDLLHNYLVSGFQRPSKHKRFRNWTSQEFLPSFFVKVTSKVNKKKLNFSLKQKLQDPVAQQLHCTLNRLYVIILTCCCVCVVEYTAAKKAVSNFRLLGFVTGQPFIACTANLRKVEHNLGQSI